MADDPKHRDKQDRKGFQKGKREQEKNKAPATAKKSARKR